MEPNSASTTFRTANMAHRTGARRNLLILSKRRVRGRAGAHKPFLTICKRDWEADVETTSQWLGDQGTILTIVM
jgi:hypothetical protein